MLCFICQGNVQPLCPACTSQLLFGQLVELRQQVARLEEELRVARARSLPAAPSQSQQAAA